MLVHLLQTYEGAFGQGPHCEAHGGSTYCAVASLILMNKLSSVLNARQIEKLKRWCLYKQSSGFQGRPNKDADTCYSFWIGATLKMLNAYDLVNVQENIEFVLATEDHVTGGLAKYPESFPGRRTLPLRARLTFMFCSVHACNGRRSAHVFGNQRSGANTNREEQLSGS